MPEIAFTDTGSYGPVLGDAEFDFIRHVVGENAGIVLGPNKRQLVQGRLARRLRELHSVPTGSTASTCVARGRRSWSASSTR